MMNLTEEKKAGYRLHRFEIQNWGTFDKKIWKISPNGFNALITGDIGSGKSTLVDGLTTLLVSTQKITYNKAAGAETKERSLKSYVLGAYKGEKTEFSSKSKAVNLRKIEDGTYSVLLASFYNEHYETYCTIAQVFNLKNENEPVEKVFIVAESDLCILDNFQNFSQIKELKKRLRDMKGVELFDSFKEYSNRFKQIVGIKNDEALDLFYQTVSMKQVTNLTEFVRSHMLSKENVDEKIKELLTRFENLDEAHKATLKAKKQIELLEPILQDVSKYEQVSNEIKRLEELLEEIPFYFAYHKSQILKETLGDFQIDFERAEGMLFNAEADLSSSQKRQADIQQLRDSNEIGKRLSQVKEQIQELTIKRNEKSEKAERYNKHGKTVELSIMVDDNDFYDNKKKLDVIANENQKQQDSLREKWNTNYLKISDLNKNKTNIDEELTSLNQRKTQIPERQLRVRKRILEHFNLEENELPFVGELIKVKDNEKEWEGAIERRLNGFGLSLIVADELFQEVSQYINSTHLEERVVFFRVIDEERRNNGNIITQSLINKIEIKSDSEFYDWIEQKLISDHNFNCCETLDEFRRSSSHAMTKEGLIKMGKSRHEKDDRRNIRDIRNYILGWTNIQKIKLLEDDLALINKERKLLNGQEESFKIEDKSLKDKTEAIIILKQFDSYSEINWQSIATQILQLQEEETHLINTSDELNTLNEQLEKIITKISGINVKIRGHYENIGGIKNKVLAHANQLYEALNLLGVLDKNVSVFESFFDDKENIMSNLPLWLDALSKLSITNDKVSSENEELIRVLLLENRELKQTNLQDFEDKAKEKITRKDGLKDIKTKEKGELDKKITRKMGVFKGEFQSESSEFDISPEPLAAKDYIEFYTQVKENDLPKHEKRFKDELNNKTIMNISIFNNALERQEKQIIEKINLINGNIKEIDYNVNPETYIKIDKIKIETSDILDFKMDLRNCLSNTLGENESGIEKKFESVKKLLVRFQKTTDEDKKWTEKVTDVREWFSFGAEELNRETEVRVDYFSDSSGKSGGQKEKLAYTILASAIAYQFGLRWDGQPKTFRLVMIDEAFGRGSDNSTKYGLELFKKMHLQLLIVTPLQKINVIENYINSVHFVANREGQYSSITNLTKKEYLDQKQTYLNVKSTRS